MVFVLPRHVLNTLTPDYYLPMVIVMRSFYDEVSLWIDRIRIGYHCFSLVDRLERIRRELDGVGNVSGIN
jgi:hypothetical protein